jgi:hypothetical protein
MYKTRPGAVPNEVLNWIRCQPLLLMVDSSGCFDWRLLITRVVVGGYCIG